MQALFPTLGKSKYFYDITVFDKLKKCLLLEK